MGRAKILIEKIKEKGKCKITLGKRRKGLLKKAYEISILSDVQVALILFSSSGNLTSFSTAGIRPEDVFLRLLKMPDDARIDNDGNKIEIPGISDLITQLEHAKEQDDIHKLELTRTTNQEGGSGSQTSSDDIPEEDSLINFVSHGDHFERLQRILGAFHQLKDSPVVRKRFHDHCHQQLLHIRNEIDKKKSLLISNVNAYSVNPGFGNMKLQSQLQHQHNDIPRQQAFPTALHQKNYSSFLAQMHKQEQQQWIPCHLNNNGLQLTNQLALTSILTAHDTQNSVHRQQAFSESLHRENPSSSSTQVHRVQQTSFTNKQEQQQWALCYPNQNGVKMHASTNQLVPEQTSFQITEDTKFAMHKQQSLPATFQWSNPSFSTQMQQHIVGKNKQPLMEHQQVAMYRKQAWAESLHGQSPFHSTQLQVLQRTEQQQLAPWYESTNESMQRTLNTQPEYFNNMGDSTMPKLVDVVERDNHSPTLIQLDIATSNRDIKAPTNQMVSQGQGTSYDPTYGTTEPSHIHQQSFGESGADANNYCNFGQYT